MTVDQLEDRTRAYKRARDKLVGAVNSLEKELQAVREKHIGKIKACVNAAGKQQDELHALLVGARALFADKQRTITVDGIKIGYRKQRGKVVIDDEEKTIKRIRDLLYADQAELLIKIKENVHKSAVYDLTAADLKRLGIKIEDDTDVVVIKPMDSEVNKLVNQMMADYYDE